MDDNKITRNILILMIGVALVVLAILFANVAFRLTGRGTAETDTEPIVNKDSTEVQAEALSDTFELELYETCVLISTDKNIIQNNRELLALNNYPLKIKESQRANRLIFSLLIDKQLPREDAILLGEEIKAKFAEINSYWIEQVREEETTEETETNSGGEEIAFFSPEADSNQVENLADEIPSEPIVEDGIRFEIQIMANTDLAKIEANKQFLESEGYKMKILDFVKDGITYYRLRLAETYSKQQAEMIGNELKENYKFIKSYWLDKAEA